MAPGDAAYFTDADELGAPSDGGTDQDLAALIRSLVRADIAGDNPGAVERSFAAARGEDRDRFVFAWNEAMSDDETACWIDSTPARRERAEEITLALSPPDPSPEHNTAAVDLLRRFDEWGRYPYALIVVPGYTPLDATAPFPGVHPVGRRRLELAVSYFAEGRAPFIAVSGGNVYPRGTPYYEAVEMKAELLQMGILEERILVEARARHSTTNLRNAGRIMLDHGMTSALIATVGGGVLGSDLVGQDFYFANAEMSTFHARCERELGYRVGELKDGKGGLIEFAPAPGVRRVNFRDALDP